MQIFVESSAEAPIAPALPVLSLFSIGNVFDMGVLYWAIARHVLG